MKKSSRNVTVLETFDSCVIAKFDFEVTIVGYRTNRKTSCFGYQWDPVQNMSLKLLDNKIIFCDIDILYRSINSNVKLGRSLRYEN